jgi:hypothetical protein
VAELKDKVKKALQENRILVLGTQVVLGLQLRGTFEKGFQHLPRTTQLLELAALGLMLLALALLLTPSSIHRIAEEGEDTHRIHHLAGHFVRAALPLLTFALGIDLFMAGEKVAGRGAGIALGGGMAALALTLFFGLPHVQARRRAEHIQREKAMSHAKEKPGEKASVKDKIGHVLLELRMVLPGAQALLGFQTAILLVEQFDQLPWSSRLVHLGSLACVALSILLLITPAAYHRIVEQGEETAHFHRVASGFLVAATVPLALGLSGDAFVVVRKVLGSTTAGLVAGGVNLVLCFSLWFGLAFAMRGRRRAERPAQQEAAA